MPKITEIKKYPRFKNNFKIAFDNDSAVIIDADTVVQFGLKKDLFITDDRFCKILKQSSSNRIMSYALYLISRKSYSKKSLYDKLISKGFLKEDADNIIGRFCELNYLNDEVYARKLAEFLKNKAKGTFYIKNELKSHDIDVNLIAKILSDLFKDDQPYSQITDIIKKKYPKFNVNNADEKRKVASFFLRRGFTGEDIYKAFRNFGKTDEY